MVKVINSSRCEVCGEETFCERLCPECSRKVKAAGPKTRRVLLDAIIDPCLCNLVVWVEIDVDSWELHIAAECQDCRTLGLRAATDALGKDVSVVFEE